MLKPGRVDLNRWRPMRRSALRGANHKDSRFELADAQQRLGLSHVAHRLVATSPIPGSRSVKRHFVPDQLVVGASFAGTNVRAGHREPESRGRLLG